MPFGHIRMFIAIQIAPQVRAVIDRYLASRITDPERVRWVRPDNFHLTVKFLGEVPMRDICRPIVDAQSVCSQFEPFDLAFSGLGAFPDTARPRTLWVGVTEGLEESAELAEALDNKLFESGFPREGRRFTPHLTIGRVKQKNLPETGGIDSLILPEKDVPFFGVSPVDSLTIFMSTLSHSGPRYEVLDEAPLKRSDR